MSFNNPIIGGNDTIVRQAMQSDGFSLDAESNVSGWRLERDGSSYFTNVTVGNASYTIDENGDGSFNNVNVNGTLTVGGDTLAALLDQRAKGVLACSTLPNNTAAYTGTPVLIAKLTITDFDATRQYKIGGLGVINPDGSNPTYMQVVCRYAWDTDATTSSTILFIAQGSTRNVNWNFNFDWTFRNPTPSGTDFHMSFYLVAQTNGSYYAGSNYGRVWYEDAGPAVPFGTFDPGTGGTPPQQYTKTYSATWSRSWDGDGSVHSTNGELVQGYYSSSTGNRISWIGFPSSTIQSNLTGATVQKVEVYLYYDHWYNNAGGTAVIGYHSSTATSAPAFDGSLDNQDELRVSGWGINVGKWVNITDAGAFTADGWRTGTHTGIVLGPGPSTSLEYYGKARGNTEANEPKLRITYTK